MLKYILLSVVMFSVVGHSADGELMKPTAINGLILSGAEYWPVHGSVEFRYPEDVLWGFYPKEGVIPDGETEPSPASASPQAVACAEQSYSKLLTFFANHPTTLDRIVAIGQAHFITNKFYLWINDYSQASDPYPFESRPEKFWYWTRNPQEPNRTPGYWKWETTLTQQGVCLIPSDQQITSYLDLKLIEIGG